MLKQKSVHVMKRSAFSKGLRAYSVREHVLVFVVLPNSSGSGLAPVLLDAVRVGGSVVGGGCEGIHWPLPSLPGCLRLALCNLITQPLAGTAALMLPGPVCFSFIKRKTATPAQRLCSTAHCILIITAALMSLMWKHP